MIITATFRALADPTRLEMIRRLGGPSRYTLTSLSQDLRVTRQGARKHLQVLQDAELIYLRPKGRQTEVTLNTRSLVAARQFIAELEKQWDTRLRALRDYVESQNKSK